MPCSVALADFLIHSRTFLVTAITRRGNQSHATDFWRGGDSLFSMQIIKTVFTALRKAFLWRSAAWARTVNVPHEVLQLQSVCAHTRRHRDRTDKNIADVNNLHRVHTHVYASD